MSLLVAAPFNAGARIRFPANSEERTAMFMTNNCYQAGYWIKIEESGADEGKWQFNANTITSGTVTCPSTEKTLRTFSEGNDDQDFCPSECISPTTDSNSEANLDKKCVVPEMMIEKCKTYSEFKEY